MGPFTPKLAFPIHFLRRRPSPLCCGREPTVLGCCRPAGFQGRGSRGAGDPQPQQCHRGRPRGCEAVAVEQSPVCRGCFLLPRSVPAVGLRLHLPSLPPAHLSPAFLLHSKTFASPCQALCPHIPSQALCSDVPVFTPPALAAPVPLLP